MPFTFAHPAIVIPLKRWLKPLSLTGLVAGSIAPDFEFFLKMKVSENIGHHWFGIFTFDVPFSLLICYLYHQFIRNTFINNLPGWFQSRMLGLQKFNWKIYFYKNKNQIFISILIGIFSHLFWDSFTHFDGFFVILFPVLGNNLILANKAFPIYMVLQILSSVIGMGLIGIFIKNLPSTPGQYPSINWPYWIVFIFTSMYILSLRLWILPEYKSFWDIFMAAMGSLFWGILITTLVMRKNSIHFTKGLTQ